MGAPFDTITFLSDYGTGDEFVGVVKSVIRSIAPHVTVIDLTHEIPAYDVRAGGLTLGRAAQYLCPGVVLAVVDPGVGTERRGDRGRGRRRAELPRRPRQRAARRGGRDERRRRPRPSSSPTPTTSCRRPGPTFAGRDVFAPAAAHLCAGVPLADLGRPDRPAVAPPRARCPLTRDEDGTLVAEVLWVDRYGNCQLNVDPDEVAAFGPRVQLRWGDDVRTADRAPTYEGIAPGQVGLVVDSYGMLVGLPRQALRRRGARHAGRHRGDAVGAHRRRPVDDVDARHPHPRSAAVRPGTTLVLAILLALILVAAALQLFFLV